MWAQFMEVPLSSLYSAPIAIYSAIGVRADVYSLVVGAGFLVSGLYLNRFVPKKSLKSSESTSSWTLDPRRAGIRGLLV